ncbi:MAG TPA: hypothetical protein VF172_10490 [Nitrososphaera sp.]|jgi:hypothetical protein
MHPDDLKVLWLCGECGRHFAFHSDVEAHKRQFNHSMMILYDLQNSGKKEPFTRGRMSLGFRLQGRPSQIIVEYEYYPATDAINYVNVHYTDGYLRSKVEGDPTMMKNIDNYLRRTLNKKKLSPIGS